MAERWPPARVARIVELRGDASARRFWRVFVDPAGGSAPPSAVAVDLGPDDLPLYARILRLVPEPLPEPPYINLHRFLSALGVAVPELYAGLSQRRLLLVEDVGELALRDAARQSPFRAAELYRLALDQLLLFHVDGTRRWEPRCLGFAIAYDERLFGWEMEQFLDHGLALAAPQAESAALGPELNDLAARLGRLPRVFSHRDYHGQNLFVQNGSLRVLDFQDALMAPAAQDLAVLLTTRDTGKLVGPALEAELLDYYLEQVERRGAQTLARGEFLESYRLCVLQHALKAIGRFAWLERTGKAGYVGYLPDCLAQAARMLARGPDFAHLRAALAG